MENFAKIIGERIRNHRTRRGLSQEQLSDLAGLHSTYIGALERGEKNATIESIVKVARGLNISLETLFENIIAGEANTSIASQCYSLVAGLSMKDQTTIFEILTKIVLYKQS